MDIEQPRLEDPKSANEPEGISIDEYVINPRGGLRPMGLGSRLGIVPSPCRGDGSYVNPLLGFNEPLY
eukprot:14701823-Alexandrium_andersonii.AAC.1